jgi:MoaA/NifB/PqqE/SkfB family radical SAM enzyme
MIANILYCIDFPAQTEKSEFSESLVGWLLCSHNISALRVSELSENKCSIEFGSSRPDVALHFKDFSANSDCGFIIKADEDAINLNKTIILNAVIQDDDKSYRNINIQMKLSSSIIHSFEFDDDEAIINESYNKTEEVFVSELKKHPFLTLRMDITNKCNLKCIMCHYKEKEIYSQPAKNISAEELRSKLADIGPFIKHIMLSCGFEPLMSKHFSDILKMLNSSFPHMEIAMCTNGMLLNSKARKEIIENNVTHLLLSFDGVTINTLERIRIGADYYKILSNIKALRDLRKKLNRKFPLMFMDYVMMNSNIHEAPSFVGLCSKLEIEVIDFRHMVGNIYFSDDNEMLNNHKAKYNYYRKLIIEESKKYKIDVRLPEAFETNEVFIPATDQTVDLNEFISVQPDNQDIEVFISTKNTQKKDEYVEGFNFLSKASCLRPFNEIMIVDQNKILPCSFYNEAMGFLDDENTLYSIFFNEKFKKVRQRKMHSRFDHNCLNCPIKSNLLPTEVFKD